MKYILMILLIFIINIDKPAQSSLFNTTDSGEELEVSNVLPLSQEQIEDWKRASLPMPSVRIQGNLKHIWPKIFDSLGLFSLVQAGRTCRAFFALSDEKLPKLRILWALSLHQTEFLTVREDERMQTQKSQSNLWFLKEREISLNYVAPLGYLEFKYRVGLWKAIVETCIAEDEGLERYPLKLTDIQIFQRWLAVLKMAIHQCKEKQSIKEDPEFAEELREFLILTKGRLRDSFL